MTCRAMPMLMDAIIVPSLRMRPSLNQQTKREKILSQPVPNQERPNQLPDRGIFMKCYNSRYLLNPVPFSQPFKRMTRDGSKVEWPQALLEPTNIRLVIASSMLANSTWRMG